MDKPVTTPVRVMLREYIALHEISQDTIAAAIGVHPSTLCRFIKGKSMDEPSTIRLINWLFGVMG